MVSKSALPNELEFQNAMVAGLSRIAHQVGRGTLADRMGLTEAGLRKILNGGKTRAKHLFDALAAHESALDEVCELYKRKIVPLDAVKEQSAAPPVVAALHKIIEAEADGVKDHKELLEMEDELRAACRTIDGLLVRIAEIRRPRSVA